MSTAVVKGGAPVWPRSLSGPDEGTSQYGQAEGGRDCF